jgi:tryptophan halogenase
MVRNVVVLGGGTAGLTVALTLKIRIPELAVRVIRSPEIGVIGVGEGTNVTFVQHFFEYLGLDRREFHRLVEPTWKLGIRFLWGPRPEFYYPFAVERTLRWPGLSRMNAYFEDEDTLWTGPVSAMMAHDKAFARKPDGSPAWHNTYAFHVENRKLVTGLETLCVRAGVAITDGTMREAIRGDNGIDRILLESGEGVSADLFVDASGFRSELLGRALGEPYRSFDRSLFCDRAVIGGWPRTAEPIKPYTVAETMDCGWCWQIEHEHFINRGYVYSSAFISDDDALAEFLRKNTRVSTTPRVVKFKSGRYARCWADNVVGVGNASGFVEPLEATAIQVITWQARTLADLLIDSRGEPTPSLRGLYNQHNCCHWDDVHDFLSIHYRFNTRLDTPFWRACRADTDIAGAAPFVEFYTENGPSVLTAGTLVGAANPFGIEGFVALLSGQCLPQQRPWRPCDAENQLWRQHLDRFGAEAQRGMNVRECLAVVRRGFS